MLGSPSARADQQLDPGLKEVVASAIAQAQCFPDRFDSAVWYKLMEPRLRAKVKDDGERLDILTTVYCETHRGGASPLPPGLVLAVIDVESRFDRWAVSRAGAVGLMQVMPFWPERLGMRRYELVHDGPNIRMGCAILRFYLQQEHNNYARALARYNGSVGRRNYSDLVLGRWARWTGADDLGVAPCSLGSESLAQLSASTSLDFHGRDLRGHRPDPQPLDEGLDRSVGTLRQ